MRQRTGIVERKITIFFDDKGLPLSADVHYMVNDKWQEVGFFVWDDENEKKPSGREEAGLFFGAHYVHHGN